MKENQNPTIHKTKSTTNKYRNKQTVLPSIQRYNNNNNIEKTSEERSVNIALTTATSSSSSSYTNHDYLKILRDVGFVLNNAENNNKSTVLKQPQPAFQPAASSSKKIATEEESKTSRDAINAEDIFDVIRTIQDPEHPLTLEQLNVVNIDYIRVLDLHSHDNNNSSTNHKESNNTNKPFSYVNVGFTPTIPHCSMATLIGLCIRVKLLRSIPLRFKIFININTGTHVSENAINRQLNDKERVTAALENQNLLSVVNKCIIAPDVDLVVT